MLVIYTRKNHMRPKLDYKMFPRSVGEGNRREQSVNPFSNNIAKRQTNQPR